jgi:omega-6 fatty acid desaturase (delta-12 desaturase)
MPGDLAPGTLEHGPRNSLDPKALIPVVAAYREPSHRRSLFELIVSLGPLILLWLLMLASLKFSYWLTLLLAIPAAAFLVRVFMIQHDCGHGSFFRRQTANNWLGRALGILTFTPYDYWRRAHALHHGTTGNLDRRGIGDIDTLTVAEYRARSPLGRFLYRLYRHPLVLFGIGPAFLFLLKQRLPFGMMRDGWMPWLSALATNAAIAGAAAGLMMLVGVSQFLMIQLPIILLASSIGVWLFYVQHQFEDTVWAANGSWQLHEAALYGSSHYVLPGVLRWMTANIGVHHIHHLCSRIPFYRLPQVLRDRPELAEINRITLRQSFATVRLTLWCETRQRLISFRQLRGAHGDQ